MIRQCEICGMKFEGVHNAKFCPDCRGKAARRRRAEWEKRTDYKAKRNAKKREQRANARAERAADLAAQQQKQRADRKTAAESMEQQRRADLTRRSEAGDLWARAQLAMLDGDPLTYWECRAELVRSEDARSVHQSDNLVGGVPITSPEFMYSILDAVNNGREEGKSNE